VAFNPFPSEEQRVQAKAARQALNDFFYAEIARRRRALGADLISDMLRAEAAGERLSDKEIVVQCNLLLVAGNVTTTDLIGNGVKALLQYPEQLEKLKARPGLIANAVEEMLRFDSPVVNSGRIADRDMEIDGCPVRRGDSLSVSLAAANRDPQVYPEADVFDIQRQDVHHHAFGGGRHHCLGAPLARVEAQEAILGLFDRFPDLQLAARGFAYARVPSFRGMSFCWVRTC
jgi:cytochrome P450